MSFVVALDGVLLHLLRLCAYLCNYLLEQGAISYFFFSSVNHIVIL